MNPYKYSVSLRFEHPQVNPNIITKNMGIKPERYWKAGEPRTTPRGDELGGIRDATYWTGRLHPKNNVSSNKIDLEDFLITAISELEPKRKFINKIIRTGGKAEFFIGIFGGRDYGFEMNLDLISLLNKFKIALGICIYLEEQN